MRTIIVMAKAPRAGMVKTRLCPPLDPADAAAIAEGCLQDTLRAVLATPVDRRVVALEGPPCRWLPPGIDVIPQRGERFGHRLACALADAGGSGLLIGMDTPQVTPGLLSHALDTLRSKSTGAVLGQSEDGGWWALGVRRWHPHLFRNVPMSTVLTGAAQRAQLMALGLEVAMLPALRDIDHWDDVLEVVRQIPGSSLARAVQRLQKEAVAV
jgi:rSAM/selenodomain-associated transferase 1